MDPIAAFKIQGDRNAGDVPLTRIAVRRGSDDSVDQEQSHPSSGTFDDRITAADVDAPEIEQIGTAGRGDKDTGS